MDSDTSQKQWDGKYLADRPLSPADRRVIGDVFDRVLQRERARLRLPQAHCAERVEHELRARFKTLQRVAGRFQLTFARIERVLRGQS